MTLFFYVVEFDEFVRVMANVYQRDFTDEEMRRAFKCFDADNSGRRLNFVDFYDRIVLFNKDSLRYKNYMKF